MSGVLRGLRGLRGFVMVFAGAVCLCVCCRVPDVVIMEPQVTQTSFTEALDSLTEAAMLPIMVCL